MPTHMPINSDSAFVWFGVFQYEKTVQVSANEYGLQEYERLAKKQCKMPIFRHLATAYGLQ